SKAHLDLALLDGSGTVVGMEQIANESRSIKALFSQWRRKYGARQGPHVRDQRCQVQDPAPVVRGGQTRNAICADATCTGHRIRPCEAIQGVIPALVRACIGIPYW